jgi:2-dehydro-3-deoxyphosphogluconate aldolase/(4S)-4-hydroxy-2-oxoglutarate aldolase
MTPSELELAFEMGCKILKIFPVSLAGGADFIKAISGPYQHLGLQFIPMGGINLENMNNYLRFPEVMAVGGSWLVQDKFIREGDFLTISKNIEETLAHAIVQK